jgi:asparagine synthase (glutamine-hydrolysing)
MCGISGLVSWNAPPDADIVARMNQRLRHRGPDATGVVALGPVVLGHQRLSIIDLSEASNQPLSDTTGRFWIVFNGEIYNYRELRRELAGFDVTFKTQSDTEIILEAYKKWGVDCISRLNGMFAFALWDSADKQLVLARDRAGEKPLFYAQLPGDQLAFASELKALRVVPGIEGRLNPRALSQYLSLNYTLGSDCIFTGVRKLPPAHRLVVRRGAPPAETEYWNLAALFRDKRQFRSEDEAADELRSLVDDAVRLRMISDVPLGGFLSGGVDSSAVVAAMRQGGDSKAVKTFTIGFDEPGYSELREAGFMAGHLGVDHHEMVVRPQLAQTLPRIVYHADEPFADTSSIPFYFLGQFARQKVTVALSGDGADELFAGYDTYLADRLHGFGQRLPRWMHRAALGAARLAPVTFGKVSWDFKLRQFSRGLELDPWRAHHSWRLIFSEEEKRRLVRPEHHAEILAEDPFEEVARHFRAVPDLCPVDQTAYVDIKTWLADDILVKLDRNTMAHSLEARLPFLDPRIIELAARLPADLKLRGLRRKYLLKKSQEGRLPAEVLSRRKTGFNAPVSHWLLSSLAELGQSALETLDRDGWLMRPYAEQLWAEHRAGRADHGLKLFGLTCLGLWRQGAA